MVVAATQGDQQVVGQVGLEIQLDALAEIMKLINSRYVFDSLQLYSLQRMDGYTPVLFFDFGDLSERISDLIVAFLFGNFSSVFIE